MRYRGIFAAAVLAAVAGATEAAALEYVPVYNMSFLGGQYFMQGSRGNLNGNVRAVAAPLLRRDSEWSFLPLYVGEYQGIKGVDDGVGAGTLYQQKMDHKASFAALYTPRGGPWKLKPSLSYKREFLKETRDESWGRGLFDYEKLAMGFEAENLYREPFSYRLGMDIYRIRFPNYQSLESNAGTDPQGNPLGRELASRNVLDTYNYQLSASASYPLPYEEPVMSLTAEYGFLYQDYHDQRLVDARGQLADQSRRDFLQTVSMGATYPRPVQVFGEACRLDSSLAFNFAYNGSNQNTYDASRTQFVGDSYSYYSAGGGPTFRMAWGDKKRPAMASLSMRYHHVAYLGRQAQDGDGIYSGSQQWQDRYLLGLNYAYPIARGFYLKVQTNLLWERSNQNYEKTYAYNYQTANYIMGFTYEY
ncbi:MAG TPA: hypothetical protein DEB40_07085 [Elusimicrobia bacterium]|nr:hypothetical protein [Elusimicrobiota bacterium]HBT61492.1 hypothetical protein [Elusimicrobiota bacterium]